MKKVGSSIPFGENDSQDLIKIIKMAQQKKYLSPDGLISHAIDVGDICESKISTQNPILLKKAEKILQKAEEKQQILQKQVPYQPKADTLKLDIQQQIYENQSKRKLPKSKVMTNQAQDRINVKLQNMPQKLQKVQSENLYQRYQKKKDNPEENQEGILNQDKYNFSIELNHSSLISKKIDNDTYKSLENSVFQDNDELIVLDNDNLQLSQYKSFQEIQNQKLQEYKELEERKKHSELDKKNVKKEKFKWQKILHHYQTQISNMESLVQSFIPTYPFLQTQEENNLQVQDSCGNIDICLIKKESSSNPLKSTQGSYEIQTNKNQKKFLDKNRENQKDYEKLIDQTVQQNIKIDANLKQEYESNFQYLPSPSNSETTQQGSKNYEVGVKLEGLNLQSDNSYKMYEIGTLKDINQEISKMKVKQEAKIEDGISYEELKQQSSHQENLTIDKNQLVSIVDPKSFEDIIKSMPKKKVKTKNNYHTVEIFNKEVIEKILEEAKQIYQNQICQERLVILRLKLIKKFLIKKQNESQEKLEELFKVNLWPKKYKYTREKGSKEKQQQIENEIEKNKPLQLQNKQLLLELSKKKFEIDKNDYQKKREMHKLENYLIKRYQDERKLSKKLQLHNQMKNFIMYSIRYVADNITYIDPLDVERQKKILQSFHLTYNKSDLQALVTPYEPYTVQDIQNILDLPNEKAQFKHSQRLLYQKQMINQYNPSLFEEDSCIYNDNKKITIDNLSWEDLLKFPQVLDKFNREVQRLTMFNRSNRIFMQRFCIYEYHKIILHGKGNKIDHFYGNNFIISALRTPEIIQL